MQHARATAEYNVYYGRGRDRYDVRGRTAHESLFNVANGTYRGPSTSRATRRSRTWTRGLAWAMLGFAEQLEFLDDAGRRRAGARAAAAPTIDALDARGRARDLRPLHRDRRRRRRAVLGRRRARASRALGDWGDRPADPFNDHEPVDSSAAAIAAQGLLRLGARARGARRAGRRDRYEQAGLRVLDTLLDAPDRISSADPTHQGLLLHSVYHWPNGWDHVPPGATIPRGESSQWGDYHRARWRST